MLPLFIPWLLILLLSIVLFFLYKKKRLVAFLLFVVVIFLNFWSECIPIRLFAKKGKYNEEYLKVMCFNIEGSRGNLQDKIQRVRSFLRQYTPDIVFLSEFNEENPNDIDSIIGKDFRYSTYSQNLDSHYFYCNYPLLQSRRLVNSTGEVKGVYTCHSVFNGDTIELYGCHLYSNNYNKDLERIAPEDINDKDDLWNYFCNINAASIIRRDEVDTAVKEMKSAQRHIIMLGDFNDVGGSGCIRQLESIGLKDAWWEGGIGYGATIHHPLPYRIDHILYSGGLELKKVKVINSDSMSDHDALYAEFCINK